jgi:hypothetical protein
MWTARLLLASAIVLCLSGPAPLASSKVVTLSFEGLSIAAEERVVGFELHVNAGRIYAIREIPAGWSVTVHNAASWDATLTAQVEIGAAALDATFLSGLISLEMHETGASAFDVSGTVFVTHDFASAREIALQRDNIRLLGR